VIIFVERFKGGAWTYFIFIPVLYLIFTYYRNKLGAPSPLQEQLGRLEEAMWTLETISPGGGSTRPLVTPLPQAEAWEGAQERVARWPETVSLGRILVPLGGTAYAEQAVELAALLAKRFEGQVLLVSVIRTRPPQPGDSEAEMALARARAEKAAYLEGVAARLEAQGVPVAVRVGVGPIADVLNRLAAEERIDLIVMTTHSKSAFRRWFMGSKASTILQLANTPVLVFRPAPEGQRHTFRFQRLLVPLDGSEWAERVLPYARTLTEAFEGQLILLGIPEVPDPALYGTMADVVAKLRAQAEVETRAYLRAVAGVLTAEGLPTEVLVTGTEPDETILRVEEERDVDLVLMSSHGHGGLDEVLLGSTVERVVHHSPRPVMLVPIPERRP
jgi:nucleotide-binding universal stress UspA family protein